MKDKTITPSSLIISVFAFAFSLMFLFILIISINYYNSSKTSYDDLIYKEFTVEKISEDEDPEMGSIWYIEVLEESVYNNIS